MNPIGRTDGERIAVLESQFTDIKTEIIAARTDIKALSVTMDQILSTKVADSVRLEAEINVIRSEVSELRNSTGLWRWLAPTLSAIIAVVIEFLFVNYLQHLPPLVTH